MNRSIGRKIEEERVADAMGGRGRRVIKKE